MAAPFKLIIRRFSNACEGFNVTLCGAAGGIGQPLSLLLKINPLVKELMLHDIAHSPGVAADLSHIDTAAKVKGFLGPRTLCDAMKGTDLIMVTAGLARKPGMTRDDLFKSNAEIIKNIACAMSSAAPNALIAIISNPVNVLVPVCCEILDKKGKLDPRKVFGVSALDYVRTNTFIAERVGQDPCCFDLQSIGGHAGDTIIPLLSKVQDQVKLSDEEIKALTKRIQNAGTEVVKAKAGAGSATLSMAYAGNRFATSLLKGLKGETGPIECAYVRSDVTESKYFSTPLQFGKCGIEKNLGVGCLSEFEKQQVAKAVTTLKKSITKGEKYVADLMK